MERKLILAIESSCDETSAAVVENGRTVLSNVIASQIEVHTKYGGVVPEVASRMHIEVIDKVVKEALSEAKVTLDDIDAIGVTNGPGVCGALLVGLQYAKGLAFAAKKPIIVKAVDRANIKYVSVKDCGKEYETYFKKLNEFDPSTKGGCIPDEGIFMEK